MGYRKGVRVGIPEVGARGGRRGSRRIDMAMLWWGVVHLGE